MRTLIILRHAKSSWGSPELDDFDRPLNDRGNKDAPLMAKWLDEQAPYIDEILCSSAARTRATADHITTVRSTKPSIHFHDTLYLATPETIKGLLAKLDTSTKTAMVIGHNPGVHESAFRFLTKAERDKAGLLRERFPTAACAIIKLAIEDWNEIAWNSGALLSFMVPKILKATK